jgi:hypothetical protein
MPSRNGSTGSLGVRHRAALPIPIPIPGPTRLGGTIGTPTPISPAAGMLVFSSHNGGTGNLSCSLPAPSRGQLTVERIAGGDNRFSCHNDDARSCGWPTSGHL